MRRFLVLLAKEEKALFSSPIAYVLIAVFLLIMGYSFTLALFISHAMTLVHLFFQMFVLLLLTVPIITMRLIAEERKLRTMESLLTSPATETLVGFGLLTSALTNNQIIAALLSLSVFLLLWIIDEYGYLLPEPFDSLVVNMSLSVHFKPFATGSMYLSDVAFYLSATMLTLFLSVRALARR